MKWTHFINIIGGGSIAGLMILFLFECYRHPYSDKWAVAYLLMAYSIAFALLVIWRENNEK
jgi:hypothetical protein